MMEENDVRRQQRNFYLYLSPIEGHEIAEEQGGFTTPSDEAMEHELRDVLKLWLTLQQTDAGELIANCAWWMTQYMDPEHKMNATEGITHLDRLTSFAVSVINQLVTEGIIEFTEIPELPDIRLSSEYKFDSSQLEFLKNIEKLWEEGNDE